MRRSKALVALSVFLTAAVLISGCSGTGAKFPDPSKQITVVVPYSAGGGSDNLARIFSKFAAESKALTNTFVFENRPGASGGTGMDYFVDNLKGNPYALITGTTQLVNTKITGQGKYDFADVNLVCRIGLDDHVVLVNANSPYKTPKDLVEAAKTKKVTVGGTGTGNTDHLISIYWGKQAGVTFTYVPFASGGEVTTAILGGHVDFIINNPNESLEQINAGKLRAVGLAADKRIPMMKDVPTLKESGYDVVFQLWRGFAAPPGIKETERKTLEDACKKTFDHPNYQKEYLEKNGITPAFLTGPEFKAYLTKQKEIYTGLLTELGLAKTK